MGVPTTHPILSMLFTHTTSALPVLFVAAVSFFVSSQRSRSRWFFGVKSSLARPIVEFGVLVFAVLLHLHEESLTDSNIVSQTTNKQERAFSGVTVACLKIRSRNEEAINSTRNETDLLAKCFLLPTLSTSILFTCFWIDLVRVLATTGNTSAVAGYTRV